MPDYRVYFLGANGKIFASEDIRAETDREATAMAQRLARGHTSAFELWQSNRCVHAEKLAPSDETTGARPVEGRTVEPE